MSRFNSDGTPRHDPHGPVAVCRACGRFRNDDEAGTACKCGHTEVQFISRHEARAFTMGRDV